MIERDKENGYKAIYLDIMVNGYFHTQLTYRHCTIFKINMDEIHQFVLAKLPYLKNKDFKIEFSENLVI